MLLLLLLLLMMIMMMMIDDDGGDNDVKVMMPLICHLCIVTGLFPCNSSLSISIAI